MHTIYSDGSYLRRYELGGWAVRVCTSTGIKDISGYEVGIKSPNHIELIAVKYGIDLIPEGEAGTIWTDSQFLLRYIGDNSRLQPNIPHNNLWRKLGGLLENRDVNFFWIKGHGRDENFSAVDRLARKAAKTARNRLYPIDKE